MKAIIFDLDNTLIHWHDEYRFALTNTLGKYIQDVTEEKIKEIDTCFEMYEEKFSNLDYEQFINYINMSCNMNLPIEFVNDLIEAQKECVPSTHNLDKVLSYLVTKYDLYVITNWFTETQRGRLENIGVLKYFKEVYGGENSFKPNKKAYDVVLNKYDAKDCMFIGDSLVNDVKMPISLGMKALWLTNRCDTEYRKIKDLEELMNIL